jgi:hypothetical protein
LAHKKLSGKKVPVENLPYFSSVTESSILEVFTVWVDTFWSGRGRRPELTHSRRQAITRGIAGHGAQKAIKAVLGCSQSEFHMGGNDLGKQYTSLELIFRDDWRVKKFASMYKPTVEEE